MWPIPTKKVRLITAERARKINVIVCDTLILFRAKQIYRRQHEYEEVNVFFVQNNAIHLALYGNVINH